MVMATSKDLVMMQNPDLWPSPFLPLTHKREMDGPFPVLGVLVNGHPYGVEGLETTVFLANVGEVTFRNLPTCEQRVYPSHEAICADWRID